jgi:hypothetical protein
VLSWGSAKHGMLGYISENKTDIQLPKAIPAFHAETIVDMSISTTHVLCTNSKGQVFVWGKNRYKKGKILIGGILSSFTNVEATIIEVIFRLKFECCVHFWLFRFHQNFHPLVLILKKVYLQRQYMQGDILVLC